MAEIKHQAIADGVDQVVIKVPTNQPKTVSEQMLVVFEAVEDADHKANKAQRYEIAFLELTLANQDSSLSSCGAGFFFCRMWSRLATRLPCTFCGIAPSTPGSTPTR